MTPRPRRNPRVARPHLPKDSTTPGTWIVESGGGAGDGGGGGGGSSDEPFNVLSVTASEVGPKYQDTEAGLHTVIGVIPVIDIDYTKARTVTLWFDFGDGVTVWQGFYAVTAAGKAIRIGDPVLNTQGVRRSGDIYVPANTAQGNWKVWCAPNRVDKGVDPTGNASAVFTVVPLGACLPGGTTAASFLPDPATSDPIAYAKYDPGGWFWEYFCLTFTPPNIATDPNYWFTLVTVQKGATIDGVWTPAPDSEGANQDPNLRFLGRAHVEIRQIPGLANDQVAVIKKFGADPATWDIPPAQNKDLSPNPYIDFRFWLWNVSRLGTDTSGSGGDGTYTLQTTCWPGATDHGTLRPVPRTGDLDLRAANPATISLPLTGGNGQPLAIPPGGIDGTYLGPQSVRAINMAKDSITAANQALAAGSVVDPNIVSMGINKVTYGTSVFAGDVVLSRGVGLPVVVLQNTGIFLYGQADASTGASGLTSKPYVAIQNGAIGLFEGAGGGSVYLDAAANAVTIYQVNGDTSKPYFSVNAVGLRLVNGGNSFQVNSNAMALIDTVNGNRLDTSSAGITLAHGLNGDGTVSAGANKLVITASQMQFSVAGSSRITVDSSTGSITISNGGTASLVATASEVALVQGSLHITAPDNSFLQTGPAVFATYGSIALNIIKNNDATVSAPGVSIGSAVALVSRGIVLQNGTGTTKNTIAAFVADQTTLTTAQLTLNNAAGTLVIVADGASGVIRAAGFQAGATPGVVSEDVVIGGVTLKFRGGIYVGH